MDVFSLDEYQHAAGDSDNCGHIGFTYYGLGLAGEAGEVAEKLKKHFRDDGGGNLTDERKEALKGEIGDVLWYVARLAYHCGLSLQEVAQANIDKLESRMERGKLGGDGDDR